MAVTLLNDLINPQVMADMISAELENQLKATGFYKVDRTLVGRAGDTITVPSWMYIGEADDLAENTEGTVTSMDTQDISYTVKKAVKNITLTDESVLSGYGDPMSEAVKQLRMSIADKADSDGVARLAGITSTNGLVYAAADASYNSIVEAMDLLENEEQGGDYYLLCARDVAKSIRKDPRFVDRESMLGDSVLSTGVVGSIAGCRLVISNKIANKRGYILTKGALTAFMKRSVSVETEREVLYKRTIVSADQHYTVAIEDYSKLVAINFTLA